MDIDSKELTEYVKGVITAVDNSKWRDMELRSTIDFELSVVSTKEAGGKVKIFIADIGGKYQNERISKIKFSMGYKDKPLKIHKI